MRSVPCDKCHGKGTVEVEEVDVPCYATMTVGHETIVCYATRQHPGELHMAILCDPCASCGGFDEHDESCSTNEMQPDVPVASAWWSWADGDLTVTRAERGAGQAWGAQYQPRLWK